MYWYIGTCILVNTISRCLKYISVNFAIGMAVATVFKAIGSGMAAWYGFYLNLAIVQGTSQKDVPMAPVL